MSRRARSRRPRSVGEVLPGVVRRLRLTGAVEEQRALDRWAGAVGERIARHTEASSLENGVLVVLVDSPAWLTQLTYLKSELLTRLAPMLTKGTLRDIRFRLAGARPGPAGGRREG